MKKRCSVCQRPLDFWSFKCKPCNRIIWRLPQIIIVGFVALLGLLLLVLVIEYLALTENPVESQKPEKTSGQSL